MKTALIGYTGFVGSNILSQNKFDDLYNSKNIHEIHGKQYDLLVNSGVTGTKWIANENPDEDIGRIQNLMDHLKEVKTQRIVHISTFDVYSKTRNVDEKTSISLKEENNVYGKNRLKIELFIKKFFPSYTIVRLPGLYGKNLKKNFIYDFIHNRKFYLTNSENIVQMYNLAHIWSDITIALDNNLSLINFSVEPIPLKQIIKEIFKIDFNNENKKTPTYYDIRSIYSPLYQSSSKYLYSSNQVLGQLKKFVLNERRKLNKI